MLRPSVRSVRRPARPYVCPICLVTGIAPPARLVRLYSNSGAASHVDRGSKPDVAAHASCAQSGHTKDWFSQASQASQTTPVLQPPPLGTVVDNSQGDHGENVRPAKGQVRSDKKRAGGPGSKAAPNGKSKKKSKETKDKKAGNPITVLQEIKKSASEKQKTKSASVGSPRQAKKARALGRSKTAAARQTTTKPKSKGEAKPAEKRQESTPKDIEDVTPLVRSTQTLKADTIKAGPLEMKALNTESSRVSELAYGLDRVLFNPGVYQLQDPRTRVYNFDPYLSTIMPVQEFDFDALNEYITSSRDETLRQFAKEHGKKYVGSSSSMTAVLSHFHFLLSNWRPIETSMLSRGFSERHSSFTRITRSPSAVFMKYKDGVYAIDADKEFDSANILMNLGKSMEKLLTMPSNQFERYRKTSENKMTADEVEDEVYHYTTLGDFLMRAQLDAHDARLPGTGMFDLKTRAVVSIRHDAKNPDDGMGYQIKARHGDWESFEREYYDMIRSAFLKYSLQVRMGRMDGIFVAFHNIQRIFGFQYVSLPEMDEALHGQEDTALGNAEFKLGLSLWNMVLDEVTAKFPNQSLRLHFETRETMVPFMYIFAEPVTEEEIDTIQSKNKESIEKIQNKILYGESEEAKENAVAYNSSNPTSETETGDTVSAVDKQQQQHPETNNGKAAAKGGSVFSSLKGFVGRVLSSEADEDVSSKIDNPSPRTDRDVSARTDTGRSASSVEAPSQPADQPGVAPKPEEAEDKSSSPRAVLGMGLSLKNVVNGQTVDRPKDFSAEDKWDVQYRLSTFKHESRARELYEACQRRRAKALAEDTEPESSYRSMYLERLKNLSSQGTKWREEQDMVEKKTGIITLNDKSA